MKFLKIRYQLATILALIMILAAVDSISAQGKGRKGNKGQAKAERSEKGSRSQKIHRVSRGDRRQNVSVRQGRSRTEQRQVRVQRQRPQIIPATKWPRQGRTSVWSGRDNRRVDRVSRGERSSRSRIDHRQTNRWVWNDSRQEIRRDRRAGERDRQQRNAWYRENRRPDRSVRRDVGRRDDYPRVQYPHVRTGWFKNYSRNRSQLAHRRNAERKAWKNERKAIRRWERSADRYYRAQYRNDSYYPTYPPIDVWRGGFLRNVVFGVSLNRPVGLHASMFYSRGCYPYGIPYAVGYNGPYYRPQPVYRRAVTTTYYGSDPYSYDPVYAAPQYYPTDYVAEAGLPYLTDTSVGGFVTSFFSKLVALGYNQGYIDAQNDRLYGYDDVAYNDPYDPYVYVEDNYQDIGYDPYSCLAQNRRYLSEGYEQGYQDALAGDAQPAYYDDTSVDLVSVLVGVTL